MTNKEFEMDSFCAWDGETLVLNILGKPGSNRDAIGKGESWTRGFKKHGDSRTRRL